MKLRELRPSTQEQQIAEMAELFVAIGQYKVMLAEGKLDEAGVWNAIKGAAGKVAGGFSSANDAINKLGKMAQDTAPVQGFDNKVEDILTKIGNANPKVAEVARKYGEWAKKNPVKQGIIIAMLTAAAALVTGPGGGAAAGAVLRAGNEILKGEKASTAIGKGIKGAAFGWLAGLGIQELGQFFSSMHIKVNPIKGIRNLMDLNLNYQRIEMGTRGGGSAIGHIDARVPADMAGTISKWFDAGKELARNGNYSGAQTHFNQISEYLDGPKYKEFLSRVVQQNGVLRGQQEEIFKAAAKMGEFAKNLSVAVQGAVTGAAAAGGGEKKPKAEPAPAPAAPAFSRDKPTAGGPKPSADPYADKMAAGKARGDAAQADRTAYLKNKQQAWQAQQRRMGKLK
jgi:hypothetical protein